MIGKISQLLSFIGILQMDKGVIIEALNSNFKDFEDALQNFAAIKAGDIEVIITRNIKDYSKSKLGVMTPEDFLKTINASR